jgi:hypothetical protein
MVDQVRNAVTGVLATYNAAQTAANEARDFARNENDAAFGSREDILRKLAEISRDQQFETGDIEAGVELACDAYAERKDVAKNTLKTFRDEMARAMRPAVRSFVADFFALARTMWEEENAAEKEIPKPIHAEFKRMYFAVVNKDGGLFGEAENGRVITTGSELTQHAASRILMHSQSAKEAAERLAKLKKMLAAMYQEFGHADLNTMLKFISRKGLADELTEARKIMHHALAAGDANPLPGATVTPLPGATVTPNAAPTHGSVSDAVDDLLGEAA